MFELIALLAGWYFVDDYIDAKATVRSHAQAAEYLKRHSKEQGEIIQRRDILVRDLQHTIRKLQGEQKTISDSLRSDPCFAAPMGKSAERSELRFRLFEQLGSLPHSGQKINPATEPPNPQSH